MGMPDSLVMALANASPASCKAVGSREGVSASVSGAPAISATDGPVEGVVTDTTFSFEQPGGVMQGDMAIAGEDMSGDATGLIRATLQLRRQPPKQ